MIYICVCVCVRMCVYMRMCIYNLFMKRIYVLNVSKTLMGQNALITLVQLCILHNSFSCTYLKCVLFDKFIHPICYIYMTIFYNSQPTRPFKCTLTTLNYGDKCSIVLTYLNMFIAHVTDQDIPVIGWHTIRLFQLTIFYTRGTKYMLCRVICTEYAAVGSIMIWHKYPVILVRHNEATRFPITHADENKTLAPKQTLLPHISPDQFTEVPNCCGAGFCDVTGDICTLQFSFHVINQLTPSSIRQVVFQ